MPILLWIELRIKNEFRNYNSVSAVIKKKAQFTSYEDKSPEYRKAKDYLKNRDYTNSRYEDLIRTVVPIYDGREKDITKGSLWYYSPKSMVPRGKKPNWEFSKMKEVKIKGISRNSYRFFKPKKWCEVIDNEKYNKK